MPEERKLILQATPNEAAMAFIKSKPAVFQSVFQRMLPELRARAFVISGIESATVVQRIRDRLADLPQGADWNAIKRDVAGELGPWFEDPNAEPEVRAKQLAAAERRSELLLRVHGFQAYQAVQHEVMVETMDAMPYWQYLTMGDDAVRPEHAALNGIILPADSPFWKTHFPPWDWGCRCQAVAVGREEAEAIGRRAEDGGRRAEDGGRRAEGGGQRAEGFGRLLQGVELQELEQNNRLALSNGQVLSVASNFQKGQEGAFRWDPGSLRIPLDQLRGRYDEAVWSRFEEAMRSALMEEGGRTVWEWLEGATA
jgi:SPP1 gp7 family putative phage head morphogenesis protein